MRTIAFFNQKGGVGKSTSCINLAGVLGSQGKKICIIDVDPQHNTTSGLGVLQQDINNIATIYDCITKGKLIKDAIYDTSFENVYVVPSTITLANAELEVANIFGRESLLKESIHDSDLSTFDFIFIDLPPTLGLLAINGLTAADDLIIPVDAGYFALEGIEQLINTVKLVKKKLNSKLNIKGVILTKADMRTNVSKHAYNDLKDMFGDILFHNVIRSNVDIAEAQARQKPITYYNNKSIGAEDYISVSNELLSKY